jgi:hypothetical protein
VKDLFDRMIRVSVKTFEVFLLLPVYAMLVLNALIRAAQVGVVFGGVVWIVLHRIPYGELIAVLWGVALGLLVFGERLYRLLLRHEWVDDE